MFLRAIVTDIEGTTTPIAFVHEVLFPFARADFPRFLAEHGSTAEVQTALAAIRAESSCEDALAGIYALMDRDAKFGPLKSLQGMIWQKGYESGALHSKLYPDVAPALRAWHEAGLKLAVYSSGSIAAQKLIFGHSPSGDLTSLFSAFFDTGVGGKREAQSYVSISAALAVPAAEILFLSDIGAELDAAREAGFATCQLLRAQDHTLPAAGHHGAPDFTAVAQEFGLKRA